MNWYIASFVAHRKLSGAQGLQSREYWSLLTALDADEAYHKAFGVANKTLVEVSKCGESDWLLDGLAELLMVMEPPSDRRISEKRKRLNQGLTAAMAIWRTGNSKAYEILSRR